MAIKVKVPNANFDDLRGGVKFDQGVGVFEDEAKGRAIAAEFGYEVVEGTKPKDTPKADETVEDAEPKRTRRKKDEA